MQAQEDEEADDAEAGAAAEADPAAALEAAGVRPALAAAAASPDPERPGPYLAAWAALLAHMLGAPLAHRRRLAAALHGAEG